MKNLTTDATLFEELCFSMLDISPHVKSTYRFGKQSPTKPQLLLVTLGSIAEAESILVNARNLRKSSTPYIKDNVFINKHMTKALAAHNARVKRRNEKQHELIDFDDQDSSSQNVDPIKPSRSTANNTGSQLLPSDPSFKVNVGLSELSNPSRDSLHSIVKQTVITNESTDDQLIPGPVIPGIAHSNVGSSSP